MKIINVLSYFLLFVSLLTGFTACKTDDPSVSAIKGNVTDIDGNVYQTITIGKQTWVVDNLRVTRYSNGDSINRNYAGDTTVITNKSIAFKRDTVSIKYSGDTISLKSKDKNYKIKGDTLFAKGDTIVVNYNVDLIYVKNRIETINVKRHSIHIDAQKNAIWSVLNLGAQCVYNNSTNGDSIVKFGRLYNFYAVNDPRNIAPAGWHIPTDAEWRTLENYVNANLGKSGSVAKALTVSTDWTISSDADVIGNNLSKNNSSGFSALPSGLRTIYGTFGLINYYGGWWCSPQSSFIRFMNYNYSGLYTNTYQKQNGFSIRCIKDAE